MEQNKKSKYRPIGMRSVDLHQRCQDNSIKGEKKKDGLFPPGKWDIQLE